MAKSRTPVLNGSPNCFMVVAIIQARMGSTRLPGKVLKKVGGKTLLEHMTLRARRAKTLSAMVIATTNRPEDDVIVTIAKKLGVPCFRGSERDVLDRYYRAAKRHGAKTVVRLTGDCPLMDPALIDRVVGLYLKHKNRFEYVSNIHPPTFPDGMDVEVFSFKALKRAWKEATLKSEREHVTPYIYTHPKIFRIKNVEQGNDTSGIRLTVDTLEDLTLMRKIYSALYKENNYFGLQDVLTFLKQNPRLSLCNRHIPRNEGYAKSLRD